MRISLAARFFRVMKENISKFREKIRIPVDTPGDSVGRVSIDPLKIKIKKDTGQFKPGGYRYKGRLTQLTDEGSRVRMLIDINVPLILLMEKEKYSISDINISDNVIVEFPEGKYSNNLNGGRLMEGKVMLNTKQVAEFLDINEKMVYTLINEKGLPAVKATGKWLFPKHLVEQWLEAQTINYPKAVNPLPPYHGLLIVCGSNDILLEKTISLFNKQFPEHAAVFGIWEALVV